MLVSFALCLPFTHTDLECAFGRHQTFFRDFLVCDSALLPDNLPVPGIPLRNQVK